MVLALPLFTWVGEWVPASAGKAKAGMVHSVSGCTRGVQLKLWDPLRTRAIQERLRGVITTRRYASSRLPYLSVCIQEILDNCWLAIINCLITSFVTYLGFTVYVRVPCVCMYCTPLQEQLSALLCLVVLLHGNCIIVLLCLLLANWMNEWMNEWINEWMNFPVLCFRACDT